MRWSPFWAARRVCSCSVSAPPAGSAGPGNQPPGSEQILIDWESWRRYERVHPIPPSTPITPKSSPIPKFWFWLVGNHEEGITDYTPPTQPQPQPQNPPSFLEYLNGIGSEVQGAKVWRVWEGVWGDGGDQVVAQVQDWQLWKPPQLDSSEEEEDNYYDDDQGDQRRITWVKWFCYEQGRAWPKNWKEEQQGLRDWTAGERRKCWIMKKCEDNPLQTWFLLKSSSSRSGYIPSSLALTGRRLSSSYSTMRPRYLIEGHFEQGWGFWELFRVLRASLGSLGLNSLLSPPETHQCHRCDNKEKGKKGGWKITWQLQRRGEQKPLAAAYGTRLRSRSRRRRGWCR